MSRDAVGDGRHNGEVRKRAIKMKFKLPPRRQRTPWGALAWALPMAYIFFGPYERGAHWLEWAITIAAFAIFFGLYTLGLMYADNPRTLAIVCCCVLLLAIAFFAYRVNGVLFFAIVAAFAPFTVRGNVPRSIALIVGVMVVLWVEWGILVALGAQSQNYMPTIISIQGTIVGVGTIFAARHAQRVERELRVAERERIARDLHDVLGHTLSSVVLKAELAGRLFSAKPERALAEINDVERIAREALQEVREAIHGYHSGDIAAEFERAESMLEAAGIRAERRIDPTDIDPAHERVLALVVREAVTNVVRHARATLCRLAFYRRDDAYCLEVVDDGASGALDEGIGMRSIRARVEALGGRAAWHTSGGTRLVIELPLTLAGNSR